MKNKTKMIIMLIAILLFAGLAQYQIGNKGALVSAGILLFGIGFGWYACKAQAEIKQEEK